LEGFPVIGTRLGPYRITEPLGAGGMGEVYRARDERLGRDVAIKVLPKAVADDPERMARFEREARALAALSHPNILAIFDFGTDGGITYAVTELLEGETLRSRLERERLAWRKSVETAAAIADGLAAAHSKGIVHRDIKPDNIFITTDGRVKVLDFGLARVAESAHAAGGTTTLTDPGTAAGTVMGTVGYMAPEQVRGQSADARSDIFTLGCLLYEMLAGKRAFARETSAETMAAILKDPAPEVSVSGVEVTPELNRIISHCLEKNPGERFQSASDLSFHLKSLLTGTAPARSDAGKPAAGSETPSIAVLPFANLSPDPDQEYFCDGMTEEIIADLSHIQSLRVISRTSAMRMKGSGKDIRTIAAELGVRYVLEGSVRKAGNSLRITAQLIDAATDTHLWADK
jgi:serine/threonine-protein kinase